MHLLRHIAVLLPLLSAASIVHAQSTSVPALPLLRVDTHGQVIPDEPKIRAALEIRVRSGDANSLLHAGPIGIELRGTSTLAWPKKQYGIETWDEEGRDADIPLMGLPEEEDWILNAPYADRSALRNVLIYELARGMGWYASRHRYCELEVNGLYQGVYVLLEKIKRDKHRVAIAKLSRNDTGGDDVTGGYMLKFDYLDANEESFQGAADSVTSFTYIHVEPEGRDLAPEQRRYIRDFIARYESAMRSADAADSLRGYARFIDVPSFVDFILLNELSNNIDGYIKSCYMYKRRNSNGGRLFMGPVWDFNHSFGNADERGGRFAEGWRIHRNHVPFWWNVLLSDSSFTQRLSARWTELRTGLFAESRLERWIDSVSAAIRPALQRDHDLWKLHDSYVWMDAFESRNPDEAVAFLKTWMRDRLEWIDRNIRDIASWRPAEERSSLHLLEATYPQPARASLSAAFSLGMYANVTLTLCDLFGREILSHDAGILGMGRHAAQLDTRGLASGTYLLRLHAGPRIVDARTITIMK